METIKIWYNVRWVLAIARQLATPGGTGGIHTINSRSLTNSTPASANFVGHVGGTLSLGGQQQLGAHQDLPQIISHKKEF